MTRETAGRLTAENINTLYGFALSRLGDTDEAEELTAEIISALLSSLERLRDDEKFYSFMWKVAQNTYV
ncbi:MAG: RNA polymerase sigma factor, partial [Candidatus Flemingiibacterium sp.]